jgi:lipid A disaccharide synthetase
VREILFVVGEASGDLHAAKVAAALKAADARDHGRHGR